MTKEEFQKMTKAGTVLLDGATGSNLRQAGMPVGVCTEQWILENPHTVLNLQRQYAEAGSQIIYAPTFGGNRLALGRYGLDKELTRINTGLVQLSKKAVEGKAYVAGDLTTTGRILEPLGDISYDEMYSIYQEQIRALAEAGADLLVAETMMDVDECLVVLDAAQAICDLPVMCTLTLEADGSALFGGNAVEAVVSLQEMGAAAVGLNCSVGPDQLEAVVRSMKEVAQIPVIAKPNAGMPFIDDLGNAHYSMGPEEFAASMKKLVAAGASMAGGCCGTTPEYIRRLAEALRQ